MKKTETFKEGTVIELIGASMFNDTIGVGLNGSIEVLKIKSLENLLDKNFFLIGSRKTDPRSPALRTRFDDNKNNWSDGRRTTTNRHCRR